MNYKGPLCGKVYSKYLPLIQTSEDVDKITQQRDELLEALKMFISIPFTHDDGCHPSSGRHSENCTLIKKALTDSRTVIAKIEESK